jgi:hypothetical protein
MPVYNFFSPRMLCCICVCVCVYIYIYIYIYIHTYIYIYTHTHSHTHRERGAVRKLTLKIFEDISSTNNKTKMTYGKMPFSFGFEYNVSEFSKRAYFGLSDSTHIWTFGAKDVDCIMSVVE